MPLHPYDRAAATPYAAPWPLAPNPASADFTLLGFSFPHFSSHFLFPGSPSLHSPPPTVWYYRSFAHRSPAWSGVRFLHRFLLRSSGPGPVGADVPLAALLPGDLIFLHNAARLYHALVVLSPGPDPLVAAPTDASWLRPLSSYGPVRAVPIHIIGARR